MIPIHASLGGDPYLLGRRAVAIALRNDLHAIVAIAARYRSRTGPRRRLYDRCGAGGLFLSFVLWGTAARGGSPDLFLSALAAATTLLGVACAVRGALLRERLRDVEAILELAIHVRETLAACAIGAYEPF